MACSWSQAPTAATRRAQLKVVRAGRVLERVVVGARSHYVFGRQETVVDIALLHESISRRHAIIGHRGGRLCVADLGSANGTFVDGARIKATAPPTVLREGSSITFGESTRSYVVANLGERSAAATSARLGEHDDTLMMQQHQLPGGFGKAKPVAMAPPPSRSGDSGGMTRAEREEQIAAAISSLAATPSALASASASMSAPPPRKRKVAAAAADGDSIAEEDGEGKAAGAQGGGWATSGPQRVIEAKQFPVANVVELHGHSKVVAAVAWDRSGARMATGSHDGTVKLWDWSGMTRSHAAFRTFAAMEEHAVVALAYSPSGSHLAVATGSAQLTVFDRDGAGGERGGAFLTGRKGDPYLHDMAKTVGHTTGITDLQWHPTDANVVLTCADDSTVRTWKLDGVQKFDQLCCDSVLKVVTTKGHRTKVSACGWSTPGSRAAGAIVAASEDGALHFWKPQRAKNTRPHMSVHGAHLPASATSGNSTSSVAFAPQGSTQFASRGADGTVKLWDLRKFKKPLRTWEGLPNYELTTALAWSPDGKTLCTGTSGVSEGRAARASAQSAAFGLSSASPPSAAAAAAAAALPPLETIGTLAFCDAKAAKEEPPLQLPILHDGSVVGVVWHEGTNQIAVGCSDGVTRVMYDPRWSKKGALLSSSREQRKSSEDAAVAAQAGLLTGQIYNPHSLKAYAEGPDRKRKKTMDRNDPIASRKPSFPETGPSAPSFAPKGHNTTQFILKHIQKAT
jgi:WD40 repeat protein/pSer/pThr/pTyr-binding forkhead associated (FHA) protein